MNAGTPVVVTVIVGAPTEVAPAPPATPKTEPRSCRRSGGISWGRDSVVLGSALLPVFASGEGEGAEAENEKEEEAWEEEEEEEDDEEDDEEEENKEEEEVEEVDVWAPVRNN